MFKLIWSALVGGGPTEWLALALGATLVLGGTFGAGYYTCDRVHATAAANVGIKAAKAQEDHDIKGHKIAVDVSDKTKKADVIHDTKVVTIVKTIHDLEPVSPPDCTLTPDVAKQLNDAGRY